MAKRAIKKDDDSYEDKKTAKAFSKLDDVLKALKQDKDLQVIDLNTFEEVERWPVSSPSLAYVLGGGLPKGRVIEVYGQESGGKSLTATMLAADVQKAGGTVAYIDAECSFMPNFATKLGVDCTERMILIQPEWGEQAFNAIQKLAGSGEVDLIIVDSVSALVPKAEYEGEIGDAHMGLQARLMSQGLRMLTTLLNKAQTTVIFINQIREKIGIVYGNPETTSGGRALRFYSSIRLSVRRKEFLLKGEETIGIVTKIKAEKNKTAPPHRAMEITVDFTKGVDYTAEYANFGIHYGIVKRTGAWYVIGEHKFQGKEALVNFFKRDGVEDYEAMRKRVDSLMLKDSTANEDAETIEVGEPETAVVETE